MRHRLAKHSHVIDKHFSNVALPRAARRRNIDRYHKMFPLRDNFSRKQMAKWACDTIASNMYVDRPYRALAVYCAHSTIDTHCTAAHSTMDTHCTACNLKKIPAGLIKKYWVLKISTSYAEAGQGNGEPYNITDGDFVVGNFTECSKYLGVWNDISGRL